MNITVLIGRRCNLDLRKNNSRKIRNTLHNDSSRIISHNDYQVTKPAPRLNELMDKVTGDKIQHEDLCMISNYCQHRN